jgi:hypothetical protein
LALISIITICVIFQVNDAVGRAVASPKDKEEEEAGGSGWAKVLYEFEPQVRITSPPFGVPSAQ